MIDLKHVETKIFDTKQKNKFPTNDVEHEFSRLLDEYHEAVAVKDDKSKLAWELADMMIFIISIAKISEIDLEAALLGKIHFNSNRVWDK